MLWVNTDIGNRTIIFIDKVTGKQWPTKINNPNLSFRSPNNMILNEQQAIDSLTVHIEAVYLLFLVHVYADNIPFDVSER